MATTLKARAEYLTGSTIADGRAADFLNRASREVLRKTVGVAPDIAKRIGVNAAITNDGLGVADDQYFPYVYRVGSTAGSRESYEIPFQMALRAARAGSIHKATAYHPVHYVKDGKLYVLPALGATESAGCTSLKAPGDLDKDSQTVTGFADEMIDATVILTAMHELEYLISNVSIPTSLENLTAPTIGEFASITKSLPTYSAPEKLSLPDSLSESDIDFSGIGDAPSFTAIDSVVLPTLSMPDDYSLPEFSLEASAPSAPSVSISAGQLAAFGTAPVFDIPVLALTPMPTPAALSMPSIPELDHSISASVTAAAQVDGLELPTVTLDSPPELNGCDISSLSAPSAPSAPSFTAPSITPGSAPEYTGPTSALNIATAMAAVTTDIDTTEDLAIAGERIKQVQAAVQDFAANVQDHLNEFEEAKTEYLAVLDADIKEAGLVNTKESSEYAAELGKYKAEIESYAAQIQAKVQIFMLDEIQNSVNLWVHKAQLALTEYQHEVSAILKEYELDIANQTTFTQDEIRVFAAELDATYKANMAKLEAYKLEADATVNAWIAEEIKGSIEAAVAARSGEIAAFTQDIQSAIAQFNEDNVVYQASITESVKNAEHTQLGETQTAVNEIQLFSAEIALYHEQVTTEVQEWLQDVQTSFQMWVEKVHGLVSELQINMEGYLRQYADEVAQSKAKFDATFALYAELIKKAVDTYAQEKGADVSVFQATLEKVLSSYKTDVDAEVARVTKDIEIYANEVSYVLGNNKNVIEKFMAEIQNFAAESTSKIQMMTVNTQARVADIEQYKILYSNLFMDYLRIFHTDIGVESDKKRN